MRGSSLANCLTLQLQCLFVDQWWNSKEAREICWRKGETPQLKGKTSKKTY
jgi:hypothetical protein